MIGLQISLHFMYSSKYTTVEVQVYGVESITPTTVTLEKQTNKRTCARVALIAPVTLCRSDCVLQANDDVWISCTLDNEILLFNMQMFYTAEQITIMSLNGVTVWFFLASSIQTEYTDYMCAFLRQRTFKWKTMKNWSFNDFIRGI